MKLVYDKIKRLQERVSKAVTPAKLVLDLIGERESPAAAGLIFLDSRFYGNDNNGCCLTFYETITEYHG